MFILNGHIFDITVFQLVGENNYPPNWFADAGEREAHGIIQVDDPVAPSHTDSQVAILEGFDMTDGQWVPRWTVRDKNQAEIDAEIAARPKRHITKLAFRNRFTQSEKILIDLASIDNPAGTTQQRMTAAGVRVSLADTAAASYIDLDRADTRAGVIAMETAGLLGAGRAVAIIDADVADSERPVA